MNRRSGWVAMGLALGTLGACAVSEPEEQVAVQAAGSTPPGVPPCQEEICGSNSPVIDALGFHELSLVGVPNLEGFAIATISGAAQIVKGSVWYNLHVVGGIITGTRSPFSPLAGSALVGAWIPVRNVNTGRQYALVIQSVRTMNYFVPPPPATPLPPPFEAYSLSWRSSAEDNPRSLCDNIDGLIKFQAEDREQGQRELMGLGVLESVVFEGDRIKTLTKTMSPFADDRWFNIGCAGHTLAKLWLTRNTIHSQRSGLPRAWEHRQATMKLLVADICGTGASFTVFGQKLVWKGDLMSYFSPPGVLEARWNENGAQCLNEPRMVSPTTELGKAMFPDVWTEIKKVCLPPSCTNLDVHDFDGMERVSANP